MRGIRAALAALVAVALLGGCHTTKAGRRFTKAEVADSLQQLEKVGLEIGIFPIEGSNAVLDGDTIVVRSLGSSLRLIAIDTEETFKKDWERKAYAAGWEQYKKQVRGDSKNPVKMATPLGEEAKEFAKTFFDRVSRVKLERDHPGEIRGFYGRYLAYVFVERDGQWVNYNIEAVRAGMSPYYTKYAISRRFDKEFREAEAEARAAQIGIWDPNKEHYPDYEERKAWWDARGETIREFEEQMESHSNYIALTRWDSLQKLEQHVGREVVLLGAVGPIRLGERGPTIVKLSRTRSTSFELVFFDKDVFLSSGIKDVGGEYVRVRGVVKKYRDKYRNTDRLQMVIGLPGQITLPGQPLLEGPLPRGPAPRPVGPAGGEGEAAAPAALEPLVPAPEGGTIELDPGDEGADYMDMDFGDLTGSGDDAGEPD